MCIESRTQFICGHKSDRFTQPCSKALAKGGDKCLLGLSKMFGSSQKKSCDKVVEERKKSPRNCPSCHDNNKTRHSGRTEDKNKTRSRRATTHGGGDGHEQIKAAAERREREREQATNPGPGPGPGRREPFVFDAATRTKTTARGLQPPHWLDQRAPLQPGSGPRPAFVFDAATRTKRPAEEGLKAPPPLPQRDPVSMSSSSSKRRESHATGRPRPAAPAPSSSTYYPMDASYHPSGASYYPSSSSYYQDPPTTTLPRGVPYGSAQAEKRAGPGPGLSSSRDKDSSRTDARSRRGETILWGDRDRSKDKDAFRTESKSRRGETATAQWGEIPIGMDRRKSTSYQKKPSANNWI